MILDHAAFGSHRLLRDRPVPWTEPVACQSYFGQAQSLLRPDATLVDLEAAHAQHLAVRPDLAEAMGARTRTGFALRTLLADRGVATEVAQLVRVLSQTSREPLVLQVLMGHSCKEIAALMGIKPGAVLTRLHRARLKLKQALADGDGSLRIAGRSDEM